MRFEIIVCIRAFDSGVKARAEVGVDRRRAAAPQRVLLLAPRERLAEEVEVLGLELRRERVGRGVDEVPAHVGLPVGDRDLRQHLVGRLEELRVRDVDLQILRQAEPREVVRPREVGRELGQVGRAHDVVLRREVAQLDGAARGAGEPGLDGHHGLRVLRGLLGRVAEELEHVRHVLDEVGAQLDRLLVGLRVVLLGRQAQAALPGEADDHRAVLEVGERAEAEEAGQTRAVELGDETLEPLHVRHLVDAREVGREGLGAQRLARGLVHAGGVEVADLLVDRAGLGAGLLRRLFEYLVQRLAVVLREDVEAAPRGEGRGNLGRLQPAAVGVLVEVVAGRGRLVHARLVEAAAVLAAGLRERGERQDARGETRGRDAEVKKTHK
jgi:hypothetical protein